MGFYDLAKKERVALVATINNDISYSFKRNRIKKIIAYFSSDDTYIRKAAYLATGRLYITQLSLQPAIISTLKRLLTESEFKIRQTAINAAGEIGIRNFEAVEHFFNTSLFDEHHSVRNAVIGSVKKMGNKNPKPVLKWAKKYLHHGDKEIRREICHGIELRGRTRPQEILPLLKELEHDETARVKNTLIHVLGQISYKKGCLPTVIAHLVKWNNKEIAEKAIREIIDVHFRYKNFSAFTQQQAIDYINRYYKK